MCKEQKFICSRLRNLRSPRLRHWLLMRYFLLHPYMAEGRTRKNKPIPTSPFYSNMNPFMRAVSSWPKHLPKGFTLNTVALGIKFLTHVFCLFLLFEIGSCYVVQTGLKLALYHAGLQIRILLPQPVSLMLGLWVCTSTPALTQIF
jgi:hypothetical protein